MYFFTLYFARENKNRINKLIKEAKSVIGLTPDSPKVIVEKRITCTVFWKPSYAVFLRDLEAFLVSD